MEVSEENLYGITSWKHLIQRWYVEKYCDRATKTLAVIASTEHFLYIASVQLYQSKCQLGSWKCVCPDGLSYGHTFWKLQRILSPHYCSKAWSALPSVHPSHASKKIVWTPKFPKMGPMQYTFEDCMTYTANNNHQLGTQSVEGVWRGLYLNVCVKQRHWMTNGLRSMGKTSTFARTPTICMQHIYTYTWNIHYIYRTNCKDLWKYISKWIYFR